MVIVIVSVKQNALLDTQMIVSVIILAFINVVNTVGFKL